MTDHTEGDVGARRLGQWLRGKYRIDSVIGVGGMAVVYAATHRNSKRFAIKMLHPELSVSSDICRRFLREGYVANTVGHPGAVAVLDDDVAEDGSAFLVMELLEGMTLEAFADEMSPKELLPIVDQLLDILAAAHTKNIIHRDIKPANIFITKRAEVKVLDFGIARLHDASSGSGTRTGTYVGTPAFMSPEQAAGRSSRMDGRSDVWAVGATMFRKLTGRDVHLGESAQHVVMLNATEKPTSLAAVMPNAAEALVLVVDRALAFDRDARWTTALEMQTAVRNAQTVLFGGLIGPPPFESLRPASKPTSVYPPPSPSAAAAKPPSVNASLMAHSVAPTVSAPSRAAGTLNGLPGAHATAAPVSSTPHPRPVGRRSLVAIAGGVIALVSLVVFARVWMMRDRAVEVPSAGGASASAVGARHDPSPVLLPPASQSTQNAPATPPPTGTPPDEPQLSPPAPPSALPSAAPPRHKPLAHPPTARPPGSPASPNDDFDRQ